MGPAAGYVRDPAFLLEIVFIAGVVVLIDCCWQFSQVVQPIPILFELQLLHCSKGLAFVNFSLRQMEVG